MVKIGINSSSKYSKFFIFKNKKTAIIAVLIQIIIQQNL